MQNPPGLAAPGPPQDSPLPSPVHGVAVNLPFGFAIDLLIWVAQSLYHPRKC